MAKDNDQNDKHENYVQSLSKISENNTAVKAVTSNLDSDQFNDYIQAMSLISDKNIYSIQTDEKTSDTEVDEYVSDISEIDPDSIIVVNRINSDDRRKTKEEDKSNSNMGLLLWWLLRNRHSSYGKYTDEGLTDDSSLIADVSNQISGIINHIDDMYFTLEITLFDVVKLEHPSDVKVTFDGLDYFSDPDGVITITDVSAGIQIVTITDSRYVTKDITFELYDTLYPYREVDIDISYAIKHAVIYDDYVNRILTNDVYTLIQSLVHENLIDDEGFTSNVVNTINHDFIQSLVLDTINQDGLSSSIDSSLTIQLGDSDLITVN